MRIYHTETQADYDALMVELEVQGYERVDGFEPTRINSWWIFRSKTCICTFKPTMHLESEAISDVEQEYPHISIEKYKAKVNEMKPTNGTIYGSKDRPKFKIWDNEKNEWYKPTFEAYNGKVEELSLSPRGDLLMRTINEFAHESVFPDRFEVVMEFPKVVVPKFVAEWIRSYGREGGTMTDIVESLLLPHTSVVDGELLKWFKKNKELMFRALIDGFEVEKEPLYHVKFPNITNCGFSIFLFKEGNGEIEIADNADYERMRFAESEIKAIDERYWPFAVPVNEESES